jgi:tetratricopeptide (TPR) repeat protein
MSKRRRVSGYQRKRGRGGCVTVVIWLGILANIGLIFYTLTDGQLLTLSAWRNLNGPDSSAALRAFENGDFSTAIKQAQATLDTEPTDTTAAVTLTRALIYRSYLDFVYEDDLATALTVAERVAEATPSNPDALAAYAFALQANGQPVQAVEVAEDALDLDENHVLARTALALGYARVGSFDIARRESEIALNSDSSAPETLEARRAFAISTADLGNYTEAGALLDELIADYPRLYPLYYERALYARQVSDTEAAETAYFAVLNQNETNVKARLRLCEFANSIGERDAATTHCQMVTQLAPTLANGWYQLGRLHFLSGDFEQAQITFNRCSTLQVQQGTPPDERIFECWYLQGQAAEIRGDCPALLSVYNQFQIMASDNRVRETWTYPPEGPPMCQ